MSALLALDGWSARAVAVTQLVGGTVEATVRLAAAAIERAASLLSGARTWSVAVLVVVAAAWLRSTDHLGDPAFCTLVGGALTAVTTRTIVHAKRRPSPSPSAATAPPSSPPASGASDSDTPTAPGGRS